jgi:hypothetical protein
MLTLWLRERHVCRLQCSTPVINAFVGSGLKGLWHLADLARRSYTGAQIWRFSGAGTNTVAQRYHIAKNGSTSSGHRQNIGEKISNGAPTLEIFEHAIQRYGFINVGRATVAPRNGSV